MHCSPGQYHGFFGSTSSTSTCSVSSTCATRATTTPCRDSGLAPALCLALSLEYDPCRRLSSQLPAHQPRRQSAMRCPHLDWLRSSLLHPLHDTGVLLTPHLPRARHAPGQRPPPPARSIREPRVWFSLLSSASASARSRSFSPTTRTLQLRRHLHGAYPKPRHVHPLAGPHERPNLPLLRLSPRAPLLSPAADSSSESSPPSALGALSQPSPDSP